MNVLVVIALLACGANAGRVARQSDGSFWWKSSTTENYVDAAVPTEDLKTDPDVSRLYDNDAAACVCVPYYLCKDGTILTDGSGLLDIRTLSRPPKENVTCPGYIDVCCKEPDDSTTATEAPVPQYSPKCGRRNTNGIDAKIVGDYPVQNSQFGEFPWMVAVLRKEYIGEKTVNLYLCGGSLIEPNVVLTAAHCVYGHVDYPSNLLIRAGEWDTQQTTEIYPHQDIDVDHIAVHPKFHHQALSNDYALLFLNESAKLSPHVDTVCLPPIDETFEGYRCYATGWGKNEFGAEGNYQNVLKLIDLPVMSNSNCQYSLRTTRLGPYFRLHDSFMCAGGEEGRDTCKGDGGSPLVCAIENEYNEVIYVQAGIVAWGIGCGEDGIPGIYARISTPYALNWIHDTISTGGY